MRIAYFYRLDKFKTHERFVMEAQEMALKGSLREPIDLVSIKYKNLSLNGEKITYKGQDLKDFDAFYFRAVGSELEWAKLLELYAKANEIPVVDEYLVTQGPLRRFKSVMGWQLLKAGVNYPRTVMVESFEELEKALTSWQLPAIVKLSKGGRHGMGTFWIREMSDLVELKTTLEERAKKAVELGKEKPIYRGFLVQDYIENDGDYRLFVVGYKTLGGFKRQMKVEKLVLNQSIGHSLQLNEVPPDVAVEAEKAARAVEVEVAGIDLIRDKKSGKVYIVEVNEAPEFKVFEKRTGMNAVRAVLEYIASKVTKTT